MAGDNRTPDAPPTAQAGGVPRSLHAVMLLGALALLAAAALVRFWPQDSASPPAPRAESMLEATATATLPPQETATPAPPTPRPTIPPTPTIPPLDWLRPTAASAEIVAALAAPALADPGGRAVQREPDPLTISPVRARAGVIAYTVQQGDNLQSIAAQFGLDQSTIIWSNSRFYVNAMRVGLELNILPVDGVYHRVIKPESVATIAAQYEVDPFTIIDSEYNALFGAEPGTVLPSGLYVVVPGGQGTTEPVYWDPGIEIGSGSGANVAATYASFGPDEPGSCGRQPVQGGSPPYSPPILAHYSITQDYTWSHGGIDLAVPVGTDVFAAGGGTVIFVGRSTWGYGYTVVIAHGSTLSLYGHLNGAFVSCGQVVRAGQGIAVSGNSGNSSGPHLHFEIRGSDGRPVTPWNYQGF